MDTNRLYEAMSLLVIVAFISFAGTGIAMVTNSYLFDFCLYVTAGLILAGSACGFVWAGINLYRECKAEG